MPKRTQKSWQFYLSKIKKHSSTDLELASITFSSTKGWIFRGSKHPKTPFSTNNVKKSSFTTSTTTEDNGDSATMADSFIVKNLNSLCLNENVKEETGDIKEEHIGDKEKGMNDSEGNSGYFMFESPRFLNLPLNIDGPQNRFFIDQTSSGSLIEEARASMTLSTMPSLSNDESNRKNARDDAKHAEGGPCPEDFITQLTCSMNPYDDFLLSMVEMIQERLNSKGHVDWEFMEELLFWYLNLNYENSYKFIVSAFVDLINVLHGKLVDSVPVKSRNVLWTMRSNLVSKNDNV